MILAGNETTRLLFAVGCYGKTRSKERPEMVMLSVGACVAGLGTVLGLEREVRTQYSKTTKGAQQLRMPPLPSPPPPPLPLPPQAEVMHIQAEPRVEANNKVLTAYIEGGEPTETPMRSAGLTGAGEIIGITDTGLDDNSCFFKDDVNGLVPRCVCVG